MRGEVDGVLLPTPFHLHGGSLEGGLPGMGIKRGVGQEICRMVVHGEKDLSLLNGWGDKGSGFDGGSPRLNFNPISGFNFQIACIGGIDFCQQ